MNPPALQHFIYVVKEQGMLNGDYAFIASSLTFSSDFWDDDFLKHNNIDVKNIDGKSKINLQYDCVHWLTVNDTPVAVVKVEIVVVVVMIIIIIIIIIKLILLILIIILIIIIKII